MSSLTDLKKSQRQNSIKRVNITRIAYMYLMWLSLVARCLKETTANIPQKSNEQRQKKHENQCTLENEITPFDQLFLFGHQDAQRIWAKTLGDMITNECLDFSHRLLTYNGNQKVTCTGETSSSTTRKYILNNIYSLRFISLYITCIVGCILAKIPTIQSRIPQTIYEFVFFFWCLQVRSLWQASWGPK